ncbi:MAG: hypothetical protein JXR70_01785 [Spirochaetales bacterium]|nr:hypothetical protein [Spirochaetales bacterium]
MKTNKADLARYLKDISTIKRTIDEIEEKPYVEIWAFFAWGGVVLAATLSNWILWTPLKLTRDMSFFGIWIPAMVLMCLIEMISGIRVMNRNAMVVMTKYLFKFMIAAASIMGVGMVLFYYLLDTNVPLPGIVLLVSSVYYSLFSMYSFFYAAIHGAVIFILGLIFCFLNLQGIGFMVTAGFVNALAFTSIGCIELFRSKSAR